MPGPVPRPHGGLVDAFLDIHSVWIARWIYWHQKSVLARALAPSAISAVGMPMQSHLYTSAHHRAALWSQRRRQPWLACCLLVTATVSDRLSFSGGGGLSVPSPPLFILPWHSVSLGGHSEGFVPPGQLFHSSGFGSPWRIDSPSHSLAIRPRVFFHSGVVAVPLTAPHS